MAMKSLAAGQQEAQPLLQPATDPFEQLRETAMYQWQYFRTHRRFCNFENPRAFSEKIFHRMRYPKPEFSRLADKVLVRDYISETIGDQYNVPMYAVVDEVRPEHFAMLPDAFVIKANHSCGALRIIPDKSACDVLELSKTANEWLKVDFSQYNREKHYRDIRPRILFEKALLVSGKPAPDYKIHVFNDANGRSFSFLQVIDGRFGATTQNLYSVDWLVMPFRIGGRLPDSLDPEITAPPEELPEMVRIAKSLARPFGYCRVDMYLFEGRIYIGELTLTPGAGGCRFMPEQWDWTLGSLFRWPEEPLAIPVRSRVPEYLSAQATDNAPARHKPKRANVA